jgi:hypothetical protein
LLFLDEQSVLDPRNLQNDDANQGQGDQYGNDGKKFLHRQFIKISQYPFPRVAGLGN